MRVGRITGKVEREENPENDFESKIVEILRSLQIPIGPLEAKKKISEVGVGSIA